jgi:membrane protein implicated in regulation of membrane protease activity
MGDFWLVIVLTFVGFTALAALLLIPVWRFLSREEEAAETFNKTNTES